MGYTHYWRQKRAFTDEEWAKLCNASRQICADAQASGIKLANWDGAPGTEPEFDKEQCTNRIISLNGVQPDEDHESFILRKEKRRLRDYEKAQAEEIEREGVFEFCKTAMKPYDTVVVSILYTARRIARDAITLSSDGGSSVFKNHWPRFRKAVSS